MVELNEIADAWAVGRDALLRVREHASNFSFFLNHDTLAGKHGRPDLSAIALATVEGRCYRPRITHL